MAFSAESMSGYREIKILHTSPNSIVKLVAHTNPDITEHFILKTSRKAKQEYDVLKHMRDEEKNDDLHPNIIRLFDFWVNINSYSIVLEKMDTDLFEYIEKYEPCECKIRSIFKEICNGVNFLHKNKVTHQDLSPENILINSDATIVKLCDFELSLINPLQPSLGNRTGKTIYCSPEMYHRMKYNPYKQDIYSLGIILIVMIIRVCPYTLPERSDRLYRIFECIFTSFDPVPIVALYRMTDTYDKMIKKFSATVASQKFSDIFDLVFNMVSKEKKRYGMQEVLNHRWLASDLCGDHMCVCY